MAGQAATGAASTVLGTNVFVPLVQYVGVDLCGLPAMSVEVQVATATLIAAIATVATMAVRTLWRRKFGESNDPTNGAGA